MQARVGDGEICRVEDREFAHVVWKVYMGPQASAPYSAKPGRTTVELAALSADLSGACFSLRPAIRRSVQSRRACCRNRILLAPLPERADSRAAHRAVVARTHGNADEIEGCGQGSLGWMPSTEKLTMPALCAGEGPQIFTPSMAPSTSWHRAVRFVRRRESHPGRRRENNRPPRRGPMISTIGGVPASKRCGSFAGCEPVGQTRSIIPPPPKNGGMASSTS